MNRIGKTLTSLEVAEMIGKNHKDLMRDIRRYRDQLGESKIALSDFFEISTYQNSQNKTQPCFKVTKKGCEFIAHKLTGVKGTEFTAKYINRFHDMEEVIQERKPVSNLELFKMQVAALEEVSEKVDNLENSLPLFGCDMDRITTAINKVVVNLVGGKQSSAYQDKSLRGKIYSDVYNQLKREFGVSSYKSIRRKEFDKAIEVINRYSLPYALRQSVNMANAQLSMAE